MGGNEGYELSYLFIHPKSHLEKGNEQYRFIVRSVELKAKFLELVEPAMRASVANATEKRTENNPYTGKAVNRSKEISKKAGSHPNKHNKLSQWYMIRNKNRGGTGTKNTTTMNLPLGGETGSFNRETLVSLHVGPMNTCG